MYLSNMIVFVWFWILTWIIFGLWICQGMSLRNHINVFFLKEWKEVITFYSRGRVACLTSGIYYPGKEEKTQSTNICQFTNFPAICLNYSVLDSGDRYCIHSLLSFLIFIKQSIKMLWGLDAYYITVTYL